MLPVVGHYVALISNRSSCANIDEQDVEMALAVLRVCSKSCHGLRLSPNCDSVVREGSSGVDEGGDCRSDVPDMCTRHNAVYHILYYLTDAEFLVGDNDGHLRYSAVFLPAARSTALLPYFQWIDGHVWPLVDNWTVAVALDFGLKEVFFSTSMSSETSSSSASASPWSAR